MVIMLPKFNRTANAYRKKHESIFKAHKDDKLAKGILENVCYESKFYKAINEWWHQARQVMKYILATTTNYEKNQSNSTLNEVESLTKTMPILPPTSKDKGNFQNRVIGIFENMVKNSTILMKCFERNNKLLQNLDNHFDRLINKL